MARINPNTQTYDAIALKQALKELDSEVKHGGPTEATIAKVKNLSEKLMEKKVGWFQGLSIFFRGGGVGTLGRQIARTIKKLNRLAPHGMRQDVYQNLQTDNKTANIYNAIHAVQQASRRFDRRESTKDIIERVKFVQTQLLKGEIDPKKVRETIAESPGYDYEIARDALLSMVSEFETIEKAVNDGPESAKDKLNTVEPNLQGLLLVRLLNKRQISSEDFEYHLENLPGANGKDFARDYYNKHYSTVTTPQNDEEQWLGQNATHDEPNANQNYDFNEIESMITQHGPDSKFWKGMNFAKAKKFLEEAADKSSPESFNDYKKRMIILLEPRVTSEELKSLKEVPGPERTDEEENFRYLRSIVDKNGFVDFVLGKFSFEGAKAFLERSSIKTPDMFEKDKKALVDYFQKDDRIDELKKIEPSRVQDSSDVSITQKADPFDHISIAEQDKRYVENNEHQFINLQDVTPHQAGYYVITKFNVNSDTSAEARDRVIEYFINNGTKQELLTFLTILRQNKVPNLDRSLISDETVAADARRGGISEDNIARLLATRPNVT